MGICVDCWYWCINTEKRVERFARRGQAWCSQTKDWKRQDDSCDEWENYEGKPTPCNPRRIKK